MSSTKMSLSAPSNTSDKSNISNDNRSASPNSSPRSSPRPSPKPQNRREHAKSDTHLTVSYRDIPSQKLDGSPSSQEGSLSGKFSNNEASPGPLELSKSESTSSANKDKKDGRSKKKSSWFNSFYPTYKSRSEDFKKIFKDVPDDERLIVDYSCALQRDILMQGRLYVTQNFLCFYANILGWETKVTVKWKEVLSVTKEKTVLLFPNAVLITTKLDKLFFTSFVARDKVYLMMFRIWQNALLDQPMSAQEMWQWVHNSYGDELGLTSDDEDYISPKPDEEKISARLSVESFSEQEGSNSNAGETITEQGFEDKHSESGEAAPKFTKSLKLNPEAQIPTDMSDTTESDVEKPKLEKSDPIPISDYSFLNQPPSPNHSDSDDPDSGVQISHKCDIAEIRCTCAHEGRELLNEILSIHIDQLFTLLFTSSKFYLDFHASRKTTDLTQTPWTHNPVDNSKNRVVNLTVALNHSLGPKTAQVTEIQRMLPCSKAGHLYSIDIETVNEGVPYGDSFIILVHYCLRKISENQTSLYVYAQVKYKKSVWGIVKGMIEKNCWSGLEDFFSCLKKALQNESDELVPDTKRKSRRKRRIHSMPRANAEDPIKVIASSTRLKSSTSGLFNSDVSTLVVFTVLVLLVVLNVMLYLKLWSLEEAPPYTLLDLHVLKNPPKSHDEWIKLLQQQETLHTVEIQKWQRILKTAIQLLRQTEEGLTELQRSIHPTYTNKVMSIIQNHQDGVANQAKGEL